MKHLVKLFQLAIALVILYPVFYVWDTDRVDNFCELVKSGMTVAELNTLAEDHNVKLITPVDLLPEGQWITSVESTASVAGYACVMKGAGNRVATAKIIKPE